MSINSGDVTNYPQTQAQWDADGRIFNPTVVAVVTDGANRGRKKWFDDIHTFAQLDYVDAAAAGAGITSINQDTGPAISLRIPLDAMWVQINNAGAPAAGEFEANSNVDATAVTSLTFHIQDAGANDQSAWFASMRIGGLLIGRQTNNDGTNASGSPCIYRITAVPTLASSRYTIAVAYVSGAFIGSFPNWYVSYAGTTDKVYTATLNQTSTNAPVATNVVNGYGGTPAWAYSTDGIYILTITGAFTGNTQVQLTNSSGRLGFVGAEVTSTNTVQVRVAEPGATDANDILTNASITITTRL